MGKKIKIEFRYVDRDSCSRCRKTAENVEKACLKLKGELKGLGATLAFKSKKLPLSKLAESNSAWINGKDLRGILKEKRKLRKESRCYGCSKLMRKPCECRTYAYRGKRYAYITQSMVRAGVMKILGAKAQKRSTR